MKQIFKINFSYKAILILIPLVSFAMHYQIFNLDLIGVHVWRQTQTQLNIQNFYRYDNNILNPRINTLNDVTNILRLEFPIMQWLIAQVHRLFGESITITRISLFVLGLFSVWGIFNLIKQLFKDKLLAATTAWAFNFGAIFYYYTINPLPDNFALCASIWSLVYFERFREDRVWRNGLLGAIFLSLAALAKLPFIVFGAVPGIFILNQLFFKFKTEGVQTLKLAGLYLLIIAPAIAWYAWVIPTWGDGLVIKGIFNSNLTAERVKYILRFNFIDVLPKLLNTGNTVFFALGFLMFFIKKSFIKTRNIELLMGGLAVVAYFFYELNVIDVVHSYYLMPFIPYLFITVANGLRWPLNQLYLKPLVIAFVIGALPVFAYQTVQNYWSLEMTTNENTSKYVYREDLRKAVPNTEKCIIINDPSHCIFTYMVDKQAFVFWDDNLPIPWIEDMIKRSGVHYMYSDCRKVDESPEFQPFVDSLIMQRGNIKVFKLKLPK